MSKLLLTNCRIVDGTGREPITGSAVLSIDGSITGVGPESDLDVPEGTRTIDLRGWTLLPGLMNMHVHLGLNLPYPDRRIDIERPGELALRCLKKAMDALQAGVTTIRSVGDGKVSAIDVRNAIEAGLFPGPRVFAAGEAIIATGGHGHNAVGCLEVDGPFEFRRACREQIKLGADLIKVCLTGGIGTPGEGVDTSQVTADELAAAVEIAHKFDKHLCVHAGGSNPIRLAVDTGVDCIEHGYEFDRDVAELMAEQGTYLVPTLVVTHGLDYMLRHDCRPWMLEKTRLAREAHVASIRRAYECGVKICNGTDMLPDDEISGTTASVHEAELMVEAIGMTPMEAIVASTATSAELLGVDEWLGTIEPGKRTDLIAVPGDPATDIRQLRRIGFVVKDGTVVRSDAVNHVCCQR